MYETSQFRKGLKIEIDGEPYIIVEATHVKPGKGVAFVKTKYKSLLSGAVLEKNFRSGDKVDTPNLEERQMQYLYQDGDHRVFMDTQNFEQVHLNEDQVGDAAPFMKENTVVNILFHNNVAISLEMPVFVELEVVDTEPGVKGDTATGGTKQAKLETGAVVNVPLYMSEGETVRIDTRTGEFVERVNR
ncbi:MAG: elongation factor P [Bradymonadales bacterium]|nr:elongation factor P [Bradymonadales bacterium]